METGIDQCGCITCRESREPGSSRRLMVVCAECGNKRCPHATFHEHACTRSNQPGQPGSAYEQADTATTELSRAHALLTSAGIPDGGCLSTRVGLLVERERAMNKKLASIRASLSAAEIGESIVTKALQAAEQRAAELSRLLRQCSMYTMDLEKSGQESVNEIAALTLEQIPDFVTERFSDLEIREAQAEQRAAEAERQRAENKGNDLGIRLETQTGTNGQTFYSLALTNRAGGTMRLGFETTEELARSWSKEASVIMAEWDLRVEELERQLRELRAKWNAFKATIRTGNHINPWGPVQFQAVDAAFDKLTQAPPSGKPKEQA